MKRENIAKASQERASTLGQLLDDYSQALPNRPKLRGTGLLSEASVTQDLALVQRALQSIGAASLPVGELEAKHINQMLLKDAKRPATARKQYGALSRFLDWTKDEGYIQINPCMLVSRTRRPKPVKPRARYLQVQQLAEIWRAAEQLHAAERNFVRFMIAVPCRLREATRMTWDQIDRDGSSWTVPAENSKNREAHTFHLHELTLAVIDAAQTEGVVDRRALVFPSPRARRPLETFTRMKTVLTKATGLKEWTFHDFRRSFASACAEHEVPETVADLMLSHRQSATRGGVLGVYQLAPRWKEQVQAMTTWGKLLREALSRPSDGAVIVSPHRAVVAPGGA